MSECVVRMEMPNSCYDCEIRDGKAYCPICGTTLVGYKRSRHENCPILCQLPEGHGDLVDSEEDVRNYITIWDCNCSEYGRQTVMAVDDLHYLPIIVPAEAERSKT